MVATIRLWVRVWLETMAKAFSLNTLVIFYLQVPPYLLRFLQKMFFSQHISPYFPSFPTKTQQQTPQPLQLHSIQLNRFHYSLIYLTLSLFSIVSCIVID